MRTSLKKAQRTSRDAARAREAAEVLNVQEQGYLEAEGLERTYKFSQADLRSAVDVTTAQKGFELSLPDLGPYCVDYTRTGNHLLLGGRKGHVAAFNWKEGTMQAELQLRETVRDVHWLHNENYFAVAQKKYVYIYDRAGLQIHCLKHHLEVNAMDFLPYHYLLATVGNAGYLKYQDTSTGQIVSEHRTKLGPCHVLRKNPYNAVIHTGHANGTVNLWSPASSEPLAKMLTHRGPVRALAFDREGLYMATAGADSQLKIWDIRTFKEVHSYFTPTPACSLDISDTGLLSVGWGPHVTVWKDALRTKQKDPYMTQLLPASQVETCRFAPFEDVLGVGHQTGFTSMIVPGAGEANYDAYEVNPYENSKQRQETEVKSLLEKLRPEMISLDPGMVGKLDPASADTRKRERDEDAPREEKFVPRPKARGKNSGLRRILRKKSRNVIDERKLRVESALAREKALRQKHKRERDGIPDAERKLGASLSRFVMKPQL